MRRGIPMAGNFLQQENVVLTGACEAIVVDVQCIFPALGPLSKCFHTKFITTSPIAQMPDSDFILFEAETAGENAKKIVRAAVENFANRKKELVHIPQLKQKATVGYSVEAIIKTLDTVTNSQIDVTGTTKPLVDCITSGVIRGAVAMVGCNNPRVRPDSAQFATTPRTKAGWTNSSLRPRPGPYNCLSQQKSKVTDSFVRLLGTLGLGLVVMPRRIFFAVEFRDLLLALGWQSDPAETVSHQ